MCKYDMIVSIDGFRILKRNMGFHISTDGITSLEHAYGSSAICEYWWSPLEVCVTTKWQGKWHHRTWTFLVVLNFLHQRVSIWTMTHHIVGPCGTPIISSCDVYRCEIQRRRASRL